MFSLAYTSRFSIWQGVNVDDLETNHFVLVHGGGFGAWCWYKTIALLEESGYKVAAIDLTGSGVHSFDTNNITSLSQYVKPLTDFLEKLPEGEKVLILFLSKSKISWIILFNLYLFHINHIGKICTNLNVLSSLPSLVSALWSFCLLCCLLWYHIWYYKIIFESKLYAEYSSHVVLTSYFIFILWRWSWLDMILVGRVYRISWNCFLLRFPRLSL